MVRKNKFVWGILLIFMLVLGLVGCAQSPAETENNGSASGEAIYTAGTYTATAQGNNGDVTVEVTFDDTSIVSVEVTEHGETAGIADTPIERIPQEIIDGQTLAVDTVTGATNTSKAILAAVEDCVKQAGGDVDSLKEVAVTEDTQDEATELTTDVVVIGGGGAGLAAAASAHEQGAEVIVLEKLPFVGGSTARSGGGISATGTRFQEELGIEDTKESWMELWKERQATSNPDGMYPDYKFVDYFMDEAVVTTEWLVDYVGHEYPLITGFGLDPVKRIHFATENMQGGSTLIGNIEKFLIDQGVEILKETPASELLTDTEGNVVGVVAEGKDGRVIVHAKKVILAAGGYAKNEELLEKYIPEAKGTAALSVAAEGSTGDGMLMALEVGATMYEEPWVIGMGIGTKVAGTGSLGMDWSKVYVNGKGERFTSEQIHYAIATNKIMETENPWLILDSQAANAATIEAVEAALPTDEVVKADTLEELAEGMGVPVETFTQTMATYNDGAKSGKDAMGKSSDFTVPVEAAPYYALKLYPMTMGTFAGVKTDDDFRVLREDGTVINNLYAAGENANKRAYNQVYMSGSAVQFALTSGRISGAHAAVAIADGE